MTDAVNVITNLGFPIFTFIVCAWFIKYSYDKSLDMFNKSLDKIGTLAEAVNHNTEVLLTLVKEVEENEKDNN